MHAKSPARRSATEAVAACPACRRRVFTRRDFLHAPLDGTVCCGACGRTARLGLFGRWAISSLIAIVLPAVLLYGDLFYSGHLFVVSILLIFGAWRALGYIALPFVSLETVEGESPLRKGHSIALAAALLVFATAIDGFMAARFDAPEGTARERAASAAERR